MHITILALGSTGDILPYTALGKGLLDTGHRVRFITFENFKSRIIDLGMDFYPIQGDPRALVSQSGQNMLSLARSFGSLARGYARDLSAPELLETNLIINQLPVGLYGYDLAEKAGIPLILASVFPLAKTKYLPLMGFPGLPIPGYNRFTYTVGELIVWMMFKKVINEWRQTTLDLMPVKNQEYFGSSKGAPVSILNGFSPSVVERPGDWGKDIHITGTWFPEDQNWRPPDELVAFLDSGPPPIFIGFGSMTIKDTQKTTRIILEALKLTNQRAIMHRGWSDLGDQDLPESVFRINYAPYKWLFPRMGMIIHHGGSGTTAASLRSGVPSCAVPFLFDQYYWGKRIAALGVGPAPIRFGKLKTARLTKAILEGLNNQDIRQKAQKLGQQIRLEDGVKSAVDIINAILDKYQPQV